MVSSAVALTMVLSQAGWAITQSPPREVHRLYWELMPQTEVWVRLIPEGPDGHPSPVNLVFHAFYPGRAERDPYTGLPAWPDAAPARLTVSAQPSPQTLVRELSLRLMIDDATVELTEPDSRHRNLPCLIASGDCTPNAVEAELDPSTLRSLVTARSASGYALGFAIRLTAADQRALGDFVERIGLSGDRRDIVKR